MNIPPKYEDVVAHRDAALGREAVLRESLTDKREEYNKLGDRYDALQQRLTVAEQRVGDLELSAMWVRSQLTDAVVIHHIDVMLKTDAEVEVHA